MTDDVHPGDALIATALLLGVEFKGDEAVNGFQFRHGSLRGEDADRWSPPYHCKRAAAAIALRHMGYQFDDSGDVTLKG
jgi:hypothetical protein